MPHRIDTVRHPAASPKSLNRRSCFRILTLSCDVWSADVHGRTPPSKAVLTRLVTHIGPHGSGASWPTASLPGWIAVRLGTDWSTSGPQVSGRGRPAHSEVKGRSRYRCVSCVAVGFR